MLDRARTSTSPTARRSRSPAGRRRRCRSPRSARGGRLLELGPELLALSAREAESLLRASGVELTDEQVAALVERAEGWAAGLYLAALAVRDGAGRDAAGFAGDDRYLADYFRSELPVGLPPARLDFLRRTSILDWMCGPLCDAVLEATDSARELEALEDAGLFLVPLDHRRSWYRYHGLFRDLLGRELEQREPRGRGRTPPPRRRLVRGGGRGGRRDRPRGRGRRHRITSRVSSAALALPECDAGRVAAVEGWLGALRRAPRSSGIPRSPLRGRWVHALRGPVTEAERWLAAAESGAAVKPLPIGARRCVR